ncbi:glycosyl hydrolase family 28-related protein [Pseudomonas trivialis]|uniref:Uncharacterized protein n=1 Tax=Pseudomonas trivialis TaxID=200450 RepID=A0A0R2ZSR3_9PSED|nr:glycosyl hydrolase family 28-related protein [Pseudomonas trivialis]KRP60302.1 hypothetical protein TU79_10665 [Pseudomonas trivialis]SDT07199.1 hypothetical protein SAMN04490205_4654 [Pseudomonas trivialis]
MPYDTLNPVPSTDPRDLYDTAAITDKYVNGDQPFVADRLGKQRRTWMGMEEDFKNAQEGRATQFDQFLAGSAFVWLGDYGAGITFTSRSQYTVRNGYAYRLADSTTLPYTTTGNWALEQTKFSLMNSDDILRQELSQPSGAGMSGFSEAEAYPPGTVGLALKSAARKTVKSFGAVGDGTTDDTAAVLAAIADAGENGVVVFDRNSEFLVSGGVVVQLTGQQWIGEGGQRSARLKKGSNGDLVRMGNLSSISDLTLNNNGDNFTGRGIYIPSGFSQNLTRVRSVRSKGPSLEFAQDAGGGCNVVAFEGDTIDQLTVGGIRIAGDTGPHPRLFNGIWLSGGILDLSGPGAGNGCSFSNFYIRNIKTIGPAVGGTALCHFANGRVASINDTTVLSGSDITMASVAFSGAVILDNMQAFKAEACTFGAGITETSTSRFNSYSDQVKTFAPTWSQSTSPQPSIGNGSLTGKYCRQGYLVKFEMTLTVGSTTTFGNSTSAWSFSLPISGTQNSPQDFIAGQCFDISAGTEFLVNGQIGAGSNTLTLSKNGSGVRDSFPFAWAAGDTIKISITYMAV